MTRYIQAVISKGSIVLCKTPLGDLRGRTGQLGSLLRFDLPKSCSPGLKEQDLNGATLQMNINNYQPDYASCSLLGGCNWTMKMWGLELAVNEIDIAVNVDAGSSVDWDSPGEVASLDQKGSLGGVRLQGYRAVFIPQHIALPFLDAVEMGHVILSSRATSVVPRVCDRAEDPTSHSITMNPSVNGDEQDQVTELVLAVDNLRAEGGGYGTGGTSVADDLVATPEASGGGQTLGDTTVIVNSSDGTELCTKGLAWIHTVSRTYLLDLTDERRSATTVGDLKDWSIRFAITPERGMYVGSELKSKYGVETPQIDQIRLIAGTNTVQNARGRSCYG